MGIFDWFKKRKRKPEYIEPIHEHKWKDFDWYYECTWDEGWYNLKIIEPFVCVLCHERRNLTLDQISGKCKWSDLDKAISKEVQAFAHRLKPQAVVEDAIADMILVDKDYIDAWNKLHRSSDPVLTEFLDEIKRLESV